MKYFALLVLCAGCSTVPRTDNFNQPFAEWVPADARRFVIDAQACAHFLGEEAYDGERKAFLDRMIRESCTSLCERKAELLKRHQSSESVRAVIANAWSDES